MSTSRSAPLRRHPLAGDHREGDHASEHNKVIFRVAQDATKPQIKEAVEKLFNVKVKASTPCTEGQDKRFRGRHGQHSDVKNAIVTLEEGQSIDVTTGL